LPEKIDGLLALLFDVVVGQIAAGINNLILRMNLNAFNDQ
jgi:hypothetical protein